jgi:hypothetical protein
MLGTLLLASALSLAPDQAGELKLTNVRTTYGYLGPAREDAKLLPGDTFFVSFDIEGLTEADDGTVLYSMGMEVVNSKGGTEFKRDPQPLQATNSLGGKRMPGFMASDIGTDTLPGKYTLKVTVSDRKANTTATLSRDFEVLPKDFGLVRLTLTTVSNSPMPTPPIGVAGQAILVNCAVIGYTRAKDKEGQPGQPDVTVTVTVRDAQGNPTLAKPLTDQANKDVPKNLPAIQVGLPVQLNRPGKFTVEIEAADKVASKKAKLSFPVEVLEQK